jgi:hypothetical protein
VTGAVKVGVVVGVLAALGYGYVTTHGRDATATAGPAEPAGVDIPADYVALYRAAGSTCPHLDWALLAAIGKIETNHGRSRLPGVHSGENSAGARGPMQFLTDTYAGVRRRHPEVGPNVYDPNHAIPAAAHLLCDNGVRDGRIRNAVWNYNHANWYVDQVLAQAAAYR